MIIIAFLLLIICSYTDLKERSISLKLLAVFLMSTIALYVFCYCYSENIECLDRFLLYEICPENIFYAVIPGGILLIISVVSKEAIGFGDGYLLVVLGVMVGCVRLSCIICISMLMVSVIGIIGIAVKKWNKNNALPYVPFLLSGFMVVNVLMEFYGKR